MKLFKLLYVVLLAGAMLFSAPAAGNQQFEYDQRSLFEHAISETNPYDPALGEILMQYGLFLQSRGEHDRASELLKRAVHVVRINSGLNHPDVITVAEALIQSLTAVGDYIGVDNLRQYLWRVVNSSFDKSSEQWVTHALQYAEWNEFMYDNFLVDDDKLHLRLLEIDQVYVDGYHATQDSEFIYRLVDNRYRVKGFNKHERPSDGFMVKTRGTVTSTSPSGMVFQALEETNYRKTIKMLDGLIKYELQHGDSHSIAQAYVVAGDWKLWHGLMAGARKYYIESYKYEPAYTAIPTRIPREPYLTQQQRLTTPKVLIQFVVGKNGKLYDIEPLTFESESHRIYAIRNARLWRMRPVVKDGQVVRSQVTQRQVWITS